MKLNPSQAAAARDAFLGKLENEHKAMLAVMNHLPEDKLGYTPHEKLRPFGQLAHHIYLTGLWFTSIAESGETGVPEGGDTPPTPETKAALVEVCDRLNKGILGRASKINPAALAKEVPFFHFGSFPAVAFLEWHASHLIHHRGQLTVYLRTMGAKVPAIYGDSLDYPMM